jgi:pimeloyl-ACP methyl ester carboxylesterase
VIRRALVAGAALLPIALTQAAAPAGQDAYAHAQVLVDVGDRKINLYCMGSGSPTVLFDAASGRAGWDWAAVQPEVAKRTRACVYDRAGLGFSDPANRPSSVGNATRDLRFLLKNNRMSGPYILVGAGFGGMVMQQFAQRIADDVVGVVLVDDAATAPKPSATLLEKARACLAGAASGLASQPELARQCAYTASEDAGPKLAAAQAAQADRVTYWRTYASEVESLIAPEDVGQAPRRGGAPAAPVAIRTVRVNDAAAVSTAVTQMLDMPK